MKAREWAVCAAVVAMQCSGGAGRPAAPAIEGVTLAFLDVRVFDGVATVPQATVLVVGDRIAAVGPGLAVPDGVPVVDGAGKTLLPGLIDAHAHANFLADLEQALAYGVTTELDMFGNPTAIASFRRTAADEPAPVHADVRTAGYGATPPGGHGTEYGVPVPTLTKPEEAAAYVDARLAEGSDYIKIIYDDGEAYGVRIPTLDQPTVAAVVEAAHARGVLAVAHIGSLATARGAIAAGADGIVHLFIAPAPDPEFGAFAAEHGVFVVPTLAVLRSMCDPKHGERLAADPRIAPGLSPKARTNLAASFPGDGGFTCDAPVAAIHQLLAAGVPILAGTDAANPGTAHGASMHEELALLVDAGLRPEQALAAATSAPAHAFRLTDRGRIAPGLRADLLLVDGDPTTDITATRAIAGVWRAGRAVDRGAYLAAREAERTAADQPVAAGPISDFEDGAPTSRFGAGWHVSTDTIARGISRGEIAVVPGGAGGTAHALRITGTIAGTLPYAWAGAAWFPATEPYDPVDLSRARALRFWTRGDGATYRLMWFTTRGGMTPLGTTFVAPTEWTQITVDLADVPGLTTDDIRMLLIAGGPTQGPFELYIDELELLPR